MSLAILKDITHYYGGETVLEDVSLSLERDSRIGLVGENGSGKTTLFEIVAGRLTPSRGERIVARNAGIAYLTQDPDLDETLSLRKTVMEARPAHVQAMKELQRARTAAEEHTDSDTIAELERAEERFAAIGGYEYEDEVRMVVARLGLDKLDPERPVGEFSGGEQTRVQLARILLRDWNLLLLDEPTNHLDFSMIFWLERYLTGKNKPYVIVSHDRRFLDKTVTKIIEIDNRGLRFYTGNYSSYRSQVDQRNETQMKEYKRQQEFIRKTEDFIRRNMAGQKVLQAKSRLKTLEKLDVIEKPQEKKKRKIRIETDGRTGNDVFRLENASIGFPDKTLARNVNLEAFYQDRISIIGKNGCGKTTLLKTLISERPLLDGDLYVGSNLKIGYYDQLHIALDAEKTVMETIWALVPTEPQGYVKSWLARFGFFGDDLEKKVAVLSGGEKARLYLSRLIHERPNLLILDEPTNHLDLSTVESLEDALNEYDGAVIYVSHDLYFVKNTAQRYWYFHDQTIEETDLSPEQIFELELQKKKRTRKPQPRREREKRTNPIALEKLLKEIQDLEKRYESDAKTLHDLRLQFANPEVYADENRAKEIAAETQRLERELETRRDEIEELETRYLELSD